MSMRPVSLLLCLAISTATCAHSLEIALPGLVGGYDSGFVPPDAAPRVRTTTFTIPPEVIAIDQLQLVLSGTNADGWMICEITLPGGQTHLDTLSVVTPMRLVLTAETLGGDCFFADVNLLASSFVDVGDNVGPCDVGNPLDLDLLLNRRVRADLECGFSPNCDAWIDALVTLTDVHFLLEGTTVAVERRTWGEIKALYP
jgi:hypothetical protein